MGKQRQLIADNGNSDMSKNQFNSEGCYEAGQPTVALVQLRQPDMSVSFGCMVPVGPTRDLGEEWSWTSGKGVE